MKIGYHLKKLRENYGYTQVELGKILGIGKAGIWSWEHDLYYPKPDHLIKMAQIFNTDINTILGIESQTEQLKKENKLLKEMIEILKQKK